MFDNRLEEVFHELVELSAEERRERLATIRLRAPALHAELSALLRGYDAAPQFLAPADGLRPARLGKYLVEREIGRGGMGIVYLARDPDLGREIAIKFLPRAFLGPGCLEKLRREARALASVNHPNVAQVHSIEELSSSEAGPRAILTMEYVAGTTLADRLRTGPLPLEQALDCARQISAALEAVHARSIVHRDLKPHNVRVTPDGWVKVLDFGLARVLQPAVDAPGSDDAAPRASTSAGTPGYMSPEQCRGESLDARSDLWAFGAVLHECLSGEPAVRGSDLAEVLDANRRGHVGLETLPSSVPHRVTTLLRSCLEPDPRNRVVSATEVRQVLEEELLRLRTVHLLGLPSVAPDRTGERAATKGNLPRRWSSFVGRAGQLTQLEQALAGASLVTLSGPGGVGKTRTALELAARTESAHPGGTWFVDLGEITVGAEVPAAVVRTLRAEGAVPAGHLGESHRVVIDSLRGERGLLLLDNCEHVIDDVARFVRMLLAASSDVRVLATSRQALGLPGERVFPLPPLDLQPEPCGDASVATEAVRLFLDRARGRVPGFAPGKDGLDRIGRICRRLDGLPLAIELAASQVRNLSLDELLFRVEAGHLLPASGPGTPERHRSMRNVVAWSYDLLSADEQTLLRRLSVFRGGCTLPSAEAVCAGWGGIEAWGVYDLVARLAERSLVELELPVTSPRATAAPARYRLLETIRIYAAQRLREDPAEEERNWSCYVGHLHSLAAIRDDELTSVRSGWAKRLEPEHANLLHGLESALACGSLGLAFALAVPLGHSWLQTGEWIDGTRWMDRLLDARADRTSLNREGRIAEVRILSQAGLLATLRGLSDKAKAIIDEALARGESLQEMEPLAQAHEAAGVAAWRGGRLDEAQLHLEEGRRCFERAGDWGGVLVTTGNLGAIENSRGNLDEARRLFEDNIRLARRMNDPPAAGAALGNLGWIANAQGNLEEARSVLEASIAIYREIGDNPAVAMGLQNLGETLTKSGAVTEARIRLRESCRIRLRQGEQLGLLTSILMLGRLAEQEGRLVLAAEIAAGILRHVEGGDIRCRPDTIAMLQGWRDDLARRLGSDEMNLAVGRGTAHDLLGLLACADPAGFGPGAPEKENSA